MNAPLELKVTPPICFHRIVTLFTLRADLSGGLEESSFRGMYPTSYQNHHEALPEDFPDPESNAGGWL
jgi:hypothetical protein